MLLASPRKLTSKQACHADAAGAQRMFGKVCGLPEVLHAMPGGVPTASQQPHE